MLDFIFYYLIAPALVLALVIFVHELGHFLMARAVGMTPPVFSVGFGREIWGRQDRRGTRWKVSIFPLGGYVSLPEKVDDLYPVSSRALVAIAGPLANLVFAFLVMVAAYSLSGTPRTPAIVVALATNGGAYQAGLLPNDELVSLNGIPLPSDINLLSDLVLSIKNAEMDAQIIRNGKKLTLPIKTQHQDIPDDFGGTENKKLLGVVMAGLNLKLSGVHRVGDVDTTGNVDKSRQELQKYLGQNVVINFGDDKNREDYLIYIDRALNAGWSNPDSSNYKSLILWDEKNIRFESIGLGKVVTQSADLVYQACKKTLGVFVQMFRGKSDVNDLGGVVTISSMTGEIAEKSHESDFYYFFRLVAVLSASIGFLNLFPFPMLDGGHLVFYAYEAVRKKQASLKAKAYITAFGVMFIILLSLVVNLKDILGKLNE